MNEANEFAKYLNATTDLDRVSVWHFDNSPDVFRRLALSPKCRWIVYAQMRGYGYVTASLLAGPGHVNEHPLDDGVVYEVVE